MRSTSAVWCSCEKFSEAGVACPGTLLRLRWEPRMLHGFQAQVRSPEVRGIDELHSGSGIACDFSRETRISIKG